MSVKDFPVEQDAHTTVTGIGGRQVTGCPIPCEIMFDSDEKNTYKVPIKPMELKNTKDLVILGRDFLSLFDVTVFDWGQKRIKLGETWIYYVQGEKPEDLSANTIEESLLPEQKDRIKGTISKYATVFAHNPKAPKESSIEEHVIVSKDHRTCKDKTRRIPRKWQENVEKQVGEMLSNGIIRPSKSSFNSNIILADKKDGTKRFVIDFRTLNKNTSPDTYPLPNVDDLLDNFWGCNYFTQLDLASGYWGISIREEDRKKTAFSVPRGKFEFCRMPFGLINAQATFQRSMDSVVNEVKRRGGQGIDAYVDNLIIANESFEEHWATLECLFSVLEDLNMSLRRDKCEFGKKSIEFLGFVIDGKQLKPSPGNIQKLKDFPPPKDRKALQCFLGLANFNRRFIKNFADISAPLNKLTSTKVPFSWGEIEQKAFMMIKDRLCSAVSLNLPNWNKDFHIRTDASKLAVGAVLFQMGDHGESLPLAYHSKTLTPAQQNWSATERELYGIISASRKWPVYCNDRILFHTDHEPLRNIRRQKDPRGKIGRWIMELENLNYGIEYIKGVNNIEADCFSRVAIPDHDQKEDTDQGIYFEELEIDASTLRQEQQKDSQLTTAIEQLERLGEIKDGPFRTFNNISITNNLLCKGERIIIPSSLTANLIKEYHGQSHLGEENTTLLLANRFYWKGMRKQVKQFVQNCRTCAQCKNPSLPKAELQDNYEPEPLERLAIDIASMPLSSRSNCCFLHMVDHCTKLANAVALPNQKAKTIERSLWNRWFAYYGIPKSLISDQGHNVDGKDIRDLCSRLGIKKLRSSPYHPQGNGSAERSIGTIKAILRAMCVSRNLPITDWDLLLPEALLAANNLTNKSSKHSAFSTMFGSHARLPIDNRFGVDKIGSEIDRDAIRKNAELNRKEARSSYKKQHDKNTSVNEFQVGQAVLLKRTHGKYPKMNPKWIGPYTIVKRVGPVNWGIENNYGKTKIVHHNLLKPALVKQDASHTPSSPVNNSDNVQSPFYSSVLIPSQSVTEDTIQDELQDERYDEQSQNNVTDNNGNQTNINSDFPFRVTSSGRVIKPVVGTRLIDSLSNERNN